MGARLSKAERLRAKRRGFKRFIEEEQCRLEEGVYDEEGHEHVEQTIAEYQEKISELDDETGQANEEQVLDAQREEIENEDVYENDEEAQAEGFASAREGNEHFRKMREELNDYGNMGARVECQVVEHLASEGITRQNIYDVVEEYEELQEELWRMYGVK